MAISVMQQPTLRCRRRRLRPRVRAPVFLSFARSDSRAIPSVSFVCLSGPLSLGCHHHRVMMFVLRDNLIFPH